MKLGSLLAIDAFVRLGGTGEAAQGLGISQATVPGLAHSILPPAIKQTRRSLDEAAAVEIMFDHVREHLDAGEADLGISYGPMSRETIADVALRRSPLVCVLSPEHPLIARATISRGDLDGARLISYGPDGV